MRCWHRLRALRSALRMTQVLEDDVACRVLRVLADRPDISQRELAAEVGIALGKINYVVHALHLQGLVKIRNFRNAQNKRRYAYLLTPAGLVAKAELTLVFLQRKMVEYEALQAEIANLQRELDTFGPDEG